MICQEKTENTEDFKYGSSSSTDPSKHLPEIHSPSGQQCSVQLIKSMAVTPPDGYDEYNMSIMECGRKRRRRWHSYGGIPTGGMKGKTKRI